eukprot:GHVT01088311.1.p1 GENE.GHVT01088311.1~~GHVT01088311.1.p1  ORF type:complete len:235 (+),score=84.22 GHVT01088311.1:464-1168(+)
MRLFFGRQRDTSEQQQKVDVPVAILKSKEAISTLEKRQLHLEKKIQAQQEDATTRLARGDKSGALLALKRKKLYEGDLAQTSSSRFTLENQINALESQAMQSVTVAALTTGVDAQKQLNQNININKIDKLMEDMQEQQDVQGEVAQALAQGAPEVEEMELLEELEGLQAKQMEERILAAANAPTAPLPSAVGSVQTPAHLQAVASSSGSGGQRAAASRQTDEEQLAALMGQLAR